MTRDSRPGLAAQATEWPPWVVARWWDDGSAHGDHLHGRCVTRPAVTVTQPRWDKSRQGRWSRHRARRCAAPRSGSEAMAAQCSGQPRMRAANTARSAQPRRGLGLVRRSTETSCRSTSSSMSLVEDGRLRSKTNLSTCRKSRYSSAATRRRSCPTSGKPPITCCSAACATFGTPQGASCFAVFVDHVPAAAQAARTARVSCGVACSGRGPRNLAAMMTRRSLTAMSS